MGVKDADQLTADPGFVQRLLGDVQGPYVWRGGKSVSWLPLLLPGNMRFGVQDLRFIFIFMMTQN